MEKISSIIMLVCLCVILLAFVVYVIFKAVKNKWLEKLSDTLKTSIREAESQYPSGHGEDTGTLEKAISKLPTIVNFSLDGTSILYSIVLTSKLNVSADKTYYFGGLIGTSNTLGNENEIRLSVNGLTVTFHQYLPLPMPSEDDVFPIWAQQGGVSWKTYASIQKKTFLHSLTAKGATLSMSFNYPSTNQLPVDSPQDATAVIKPTTNEYFASPVVVIATKKISDSYNCIHYNGTLWKFALWDGTSFTDGEAVTDWKDSVVTVD